jgi:hypothetical protein
LGTLAALIPAGVVEENEGKAGPVAAYARAAAAAAARGEGEEEERAWAKVSDG